MRQPTINQQANNSLGKRVGNIQTDYYDTRFTDKEPYISVKTGVTDHLGDEIILTVFPNRHVVTDEGYTEFVLGTERKPRSINQAKLLIATHDVEIKKGHTPQLYITYTGEEWEKQADKLLACIVDVYSLALY